VLLEINVNKVKKREFEMSQGLLTAIAKTTYGAAMLERNAAVAKLEAIIQFLSKRFKTPSTKLQKKIKEVDDIEQLDELVGFAATCVSLDEFATAFN
jgi:hypothetical protein